MQDAATLSKLNIAGKVATQNLNRSNSKASIRFSGGAGNDTLTNWSGGKGSTSLGWSGNDIIYGFDNAYMLQITGDWSVAYYSGSDKILFKVD